MESYLFESVAARFAQTGTLTPYAFFAIVIWKSNRTKTKIARGLASTGTAVTTLMREVSEASIPGDKVNTLLQIPGIGLAMASAILTVCYPHEFTVLDYGFGTPCTRLMCLTCRRATPPRPWNTCNIVWPARNLPGGWAFRCASWIAHCGRKTGKMTYLS